MKILYRIVGIILFIFFFGFAIKNAQEATLNFFWGYEIRGPLVLLLLGFFMGGAVLGILAMTPMTFRYRRELSKHRTALDTMKKDSRQINPAPPGVL